MDVFIRTVLEHYRTQGRRNLSWRHKKYLSPYAIAVSEVMLQQTQVSRVIDYFQKWMGLFPNLFSLAEASPKNVLLAWQGLGYNNRGLRLLYMAQKLVQEYQGKFPTTASELKSLPGIGDYTAGAIMAFAYDKPVVMIETNIRRVFIHHFYRNKNDIPDSELLKKIEKALDYVVKNNVSSPREWYWALMDYGAHLPKVTGKNANTASRHYTKQSRFDGSVRQIRSHITKWLLVHKKVTREHLPEVLGIQNENDDRIEKAIVGLLRDGVINKTGRFYSLVTE